MSGEFPFTLTGSLGSPGFFGAKKIVAAGGGTTIITVSGSGPNSTGPFAIASSVPPMNNGDGAGYWDGSNNTFISAVGSTTPVVPLLNGKVLSTIGWQGSGNGFIVSTQNVVAQNFFANVKIVSGATILNFPTSAPTYFSSNTDFPGVTVWRWVDSHEFSVGLTTYTATFT